MLITLFNHYIRYKCIKLSYWRLAHMLKISMLAAWKGEIGRNGSWTVAQVRPSSQPMAGHGGMHCHPSYMRKQK
jgi:hypothetical protein